MILIKNQKTRRIKRIKRRTRRRDLFGRNHSRRRKLRKLVNKDPNRKQKQNPRLTPHQPHPVPTKKRELLRVGASLRPRTVMRGQRSPAARLGPSGRRRRPQAGTTTTRRRSGPGSRRE